MQVIKHVIFVMFCISGPLAACGQPDFSFGFRWGGSGNDYSLGHVTDTLGNSVIAGFFSGSFDADPGIGIKMLHASEGNCFIKKIDPLGALIWIKQFNLGSFSVPLANAYSTAPVNAVTLDAAQNIFLAGTWNNYDKADFDPGPGFANLDSVKSNAYILKLNKDGDFVWVRRVGGLVDSECRIYDIAADDRGNIYACGGFRGNVDFDPGALTDTQRAKGTANLMDLFVLKLNSAGSYEWSYQAGGEKDDYASALVIDGENNVCAVGSYSGYVDFNNEQDSAVLSGNVYRSVFILKLNTVGKYIWVKSLETSGGNADLTTIAISKDKKHTYIGGHYQGILRFTPGQSSSRDSALSRAGIICKLDSAGSFIWKQKFGLDGNIIGSNSLPVVETAHLTVDDKDRVHTVGRFRNTVDFDPGEGVYNLKSKSTTGESDLFYLILSSKGDHIFAGQNEVTPDFLSLPTVTGITVDQSGDIYCSGTFSNTIDLDPRADATVLVKSSGGQEGFFYSMKRFACTSNTIIRQIVDSSCGNYVSPSGGHIWRLSGKYQDTLRTSTGCDSLILQIDLHIPSTDTTKIDYTACQMYVTPSGRDTFFSSGYYFDRLLSAFGCDSIIAIDLRIENPIVHNTSYTVCGHFSAPSGRYLWNESGTYIDSIATEEGCDSVVIIDLTVIPHISNLNVIPNKAFLEAEIQDCMYQWVDCDRNHAFIEGAINRQFYPTQPGRYAVILSNGICYDTSDCYNFEPLKTVPIENSSNIILYPNPSQDYLVAEIDIKGMSCSAFKIKDVFGREVKGSKNLHRNSGQIKISVGDLENGSYSLELLMDDGIWSKRFIICR